MITHKRLQHATQKGLQETQKRWQWEWGWPGEAGGGGEQGAGSREQGAREQGGPCSGNRGRASTWEPGPSID
jgi:hypothetical protein